MLKSKGFNRGINLGGWFSQCDYSEERLNSFITEKDFQEYKDAGFTLLYPEYDAPFNSASTFKGSVLEKYMETADKVGLDVLAYSGHIVGWIGEGGSALSSSQKSHINEIINTLSKYESFVLTVDEYLKEFESEWTTKGTIKVDDGVIYNDYVSTKDGEKEKHTDSYKGKISSLMDLLDISAGYIEYFFSENDDYGYAMCKYKEDSKSYYVEIDMDGTPCDVNIWFENGKIVKITCVGQDDEQKFDFTYSFAF